MLRRILYTSRAMPGITMRDVYDIIRVSHDRDSQCGTTGGLLFIDGHFIQMMEGLPASIETRFEKIRRDKRHEDIVIRQEMDVVAPIFSDDWMALRDGSIAGLFVATVARQWFSCSVSSSRPSRRSDSRIDHPDHRQGA